MRTRLNKKAASNRYRGQESAGIVTCKYKSEPFKVCRSEGLVSQAFSEMSMMSLKGNLGVGHTRYSTSGGSGSIQLAQPFVVHTSYGTIAVAHNGELANSYKLRETLLSHGVGLTTGGDSELITQCLSQPPPEEFKHPRFRPRKSSISSTTGCTAGASAAVAAKPAPTQASPPTSPTEPARLPIWKADLNADENNITSRLLHLMSLTPVSYSLIVMYNECLYATRDSFGNRPLAIGMLMPPPNAGDFGSTPFSIVDNCFIEGWVISSESCPFPSVHAKLKRDVNPGEVIKFERNKMPKTLAYMPRPGFAESPAFCIFEYVYFARPDSIMETQTVYSVRKKCGQRLARESSPFPANCPASVKQNYIVAPVPESSIPAALGFAQEVGLPYVEVFCKNRYVGRTFIQPSARLRWLGVAKKFGPLTENFVGKNIILIDDSIVRGTTMGQLVRLLREAGAEKVHIRIASPPLHYPCNMGINIPTREELIANTHTAEQLAVSLGAASLKYLSVRGLRESVESGIKANIIADKSRVLMPQVGESSFDIVAGKSTSVDDLAKCVSRKSSELALDKSNATEEDDDLAAGRKASESQEISTELQEELKRRVGHCDACLTGRYPAKLDEDDGF